jgi:hypothetical protein
MLFINFSRRYYKQDNACQEKSEWFSTENSLGQIEREAVTSFSLSLFLLYIILL